MEKILEKDNIRAEEQIKDEFKEKAVELLESKEYSKFYLSIKTKFFVGLAVAFLWLIVSIWLSKDWLRDLSLMTSPIFAFIVIAGIAYVPGFMNAFLVISLLMDKQPKLKNVTKVKESVTILVSAFNEERGIYDTLKYIKKQEYAGNIHIIVIDNNSKDNTSKEVLRAKEELNMDILLLKEPTPGKFNALNLGLKYVKTKYVITLDADTLIHPKAVAYLVSRIKASSSDVCAVAGSMLVRNSRDNLLAKIQEWDYFLSIASIKRMQGLYQGTLVAQGAFSLYKTDVVSNLGGWSDAIGEDIVLTWKMLAENKRVYFEPHAVAFTDVPVKLSHFIKQRSRWARGMIEGLREIKPWRQPLMFAKFLTGIDFLIPYMDFSYTLFWIPGLILALFFRNYAIVGPMILLVLPITLLSFWILYYYQANVVFKNLNLKVRKNYLGFIFFILTYQILMSPISLYGYFQEFIGAKRVWK